MDNQLQKYLDNTAKKTISLINSLQKLVLFIEENPVKGQNIKIATLREVTDLKDNIIYYERKFSKIYV